MAMDLLFLSLIMLGLAYSLFYVFEHKNYIIEKVKELLKK